MIITQQTDCNKTMNVYTALCAAVARLTRAITPCCQWSLLWPWVSWSSRGERLLKKKSSNEHFLTNWPEYKHNLSSHFFFQLSCLLLKKKFQLLTCEYLVYFLILSISSGFPMSNWTGSDGNPCSLNLLNTNEYFDSTAFYMILPFFILTLWYWFQPRWPGPTLLSKPMND